MGDALRIRQVLTNLISNAIKFTPAGSVVLRVTRGPEGLAFAVVDTGIGIGAEGLERLFDRFSQVDASTTRRYGGTGLGLAISQEIIGLMGGRLRVESSVGGGSCFSFTLPLRWLGASCAAVADPVVGADLEHASQRFSILAAEDNPTNQLVLTSLLQPLDVDLTLVATGRAAVEAFKLARPDVILMDIQMPEMNGVDATREIRALERAEGWPRTPIIALTANVMAHQLDEYRQAGMDAEVAKPIELEKLYDALDAALSGVPSAAPQNRAVSEATSAPLTAVASAST
jgi:CheY-like chemotaxis protein/anti-sigma regulatory factor (Ser/Thr protein kinase)